MGKTWFSVATALVLIVLSIGVFVGRRLLLGADIGGPHGRASWEVTLQVTGEMEDADSTAVTVLALDFRRQHIFAEHLESTDLLHRVARRRRQGRREVVWRRADMGGGRLPFQLTYSFRCLLEMRRPTAAMARRTADLDAAPTPGAHLKPTRRIESDRQEVFEQARRLVHKGDSRIDQVRNLFDYVKGLANDPAGPDGALRCLRRGAGSSAGKSRLLVALCRNRGIPARLVSGLILTRSRQQHLHVWCEAWVNGSWLPLCPTYDYFDTREFPGNYLVLQLADDQPVRPHGVRGLRSTFTVQERHGGAGPEAGQAPAVRTVWRNFSFYALHPAEQHLVTFLLLLPLGALIVSVFRTVVGVPTFGTFSPALIGLAFLDLKALPLGLSIFVAAILVGWGCRRLLDRYHLLLVARSSILLTLIIVFLIVVIVVASRYGVAATQFISLFPLVILTHLVERFWTLETEDGTAASFKTLLGTLVVGLTVSVCLSPSAVGSWMFRYPETVGLVLAAQFLLGRYTGYRLSELYRFSELIPEDSGKTINPKSEIRNPKQTAMTEAENTEQQPARF